MKLHETYRGLSILDDGDFGFVIFDPMSTTAERLEMVRELAAANSLDSLWFNSIAAARDAIDSFLALNPERA